MEKFTKTQVSILIVVALVMGFGLFYINKTAYKKDLDGVVITRKSTIINGVVERTKPIKGSVKVWLKSGGEILIYAGSNYNYKKTNLSNFLINNDSIVKRTNSDTIFVFRENERYFFLLNKSVEIIIPR